MQDHEFGIEVREPSFASVASGAALERLCDGLSSCDGPVWVAREEMLLWSDVTNNRILVWREGEGMSVWRDRAEFTCGHALDRDGSLLHCSLGLRAIVRTPLRDGSLRPDTQDEMVERSFHGKRFNAPTDIAVRRDGSIWFTDPAHMLRGGQVVPRTDGEMGGHFVFCLKPDGTLEGVLKHFEEPNALVFSPDERRLFVSDSSAGSRVDGGGNRHVEVFDVVEGGLANRRIFAQLDSGVPDGLVVDHAGRVYVACTDGVRVFAPGGAELARIRLPEPVANLTFGGKTGDWLFMAGRSSIYRTRLALRRPAQAQTRAVTA